MSDPSPALQVAIVAALRGYAPLQALIVQRVYDSPPEKPTFPYVTLGEGHLLGDDTEDCGEGSEAFVQIDAWSRASTFEQTKQIAAAIRGAIKATPIELTGFVVTVTEFVQTLYLRDPDGLTRHARVEFRFLITHTN